MDFNLDWDSKFDPPNAQETFEDMLDESDSELEAMMQTTANRIERDAKSMAPVGETGNLRASIENEVESKRKAIIAEVGSNVEYAPYVEYGTSRMEAQPYLRPALEDHASSLEREIRLAVMKAASNASSGFL